MIEQVASSFKSWINLASYEWFRHVCVVQYLYDLSLIDSLQQNILWNWTRIILVLFSDCFELVFYVNYNRTDMHIEQFYNKIILVQYRKLLKSGCYWNNQNPLISQIFLVHKHVQYKKETHQMPLNQDYVNHLFV